MITGGSSGIGEAICRMLAVEGAIPVIIDRNQDQGRALAEEFQGMGLDSIFVLAELADPEECQTAVTTTLKKYRHLHGLVNNAGTNDRVGLETGNPQRFLNSLGDNLHHYYYMAHYCLHALKTSRGSMVNISSKTAITGQGGTSSYAAAKGAQLAMTRDWAVELLKYKIRVNAVVPSEVMTPMYQSWLASFEDPDSKLKEITDRIPLGKRMTTVREIASMTVYLLSEQASHITGQFMFVDGGYVHLDRALAGI